MTPSAKHSDAVWRNHGTEPMKPLDGPGLTHLEIQQLVQVLTLQAQAIDRLAASNEALVDAMMAEDEQDEDQPQRDMAGNLIRTS